MKRNWWWLLILAAVYFWINIPTFHDGLFHVYDNVQVTRIIATADELKSGQFPVRYFASFGHGAGYWLLKYYSPLIYYLGAAINLIGFSPIQAVKLIYLLATAAGMVGMWKLLRFRYQKLASTLGTLAFMTSPYLYHDLFHRGSLTEAAAMLITPWVWWSVIRLKANVGIKKMLVGGLCLAIVMLTHALTAMMVLASMELYWLIMPKQAKFSWMLIGMTLIGWGLSAFNYLPAITERNLTQYENNSLLTRGYLDHPVAIGNQWMNVANEPEKSAYLGTTLLITLIVLVAGMLRKQKLEPKRWGWYVIIVALVGLYLMDPTSRAVWERVVYLRYFQFPFRLLAIVTPALVLGYGALVERYQQSKVITILLIGLWIGPLLWTKQYYQVLGYQYGISYTVDDPCMTSTWADEYLSRWTKQCVKTKIPPYTLLTNDLKIQNEIELHNGRKIVLETEGAGNMVIGKYYAPEWRASDEHGKLLNIYPSENQGLLELEVPTGTKRIEIAQTKTTSETWGDWISASTLVGVLGGLLWKVGGQKSSGRAKAESRANSPSRRKRDNG